MQKYTVGIDLGTTNTTVCYLELNQDNENDLNYQFLKLSGSSLIPSVIGLDHNNEFIFGKAAKDRNDSSLEVLGYYKLGMLNPQKTYPLCGNNYTAKELSTMFLEFIREQLFEHTEIKSNEQIAKLVVSKPAAFTLEANRSTYEAALDAGFQLTMDDLISEPVAACYHHGFGESVGTGLVYDLGGGTFDSTLVDFDKKEVKRTEGSGDIHELGGKNFDESILKIAERKSQMTFDRSDAIEHSKVLHKCQQVKEKLSFESSARLEFVQHDEEFEVEITRAEFEDQCHDLITQTLRLSEKALTDSGCSFSEVEKIIPVGGSTNMPIVKQTLENKFSGCNIAWDDEATDTMVAIGAAKYARTLLLMDTVEVVVKAQHSYGAISLNHKADDFLNTIMVAKDSVLPASHIKTFKADGPTAQFYLTQYTGQDEVQTEDQHIDPRDLSISMLEIFTVENIKPPYVLEVEYSLSKGDVPNITVTQAENDNLKFSSERNVDKAFLDEPIPTVNGQDGSTYIMFCADLSGSMIPDGINDVKKYFRQTVLGEYKDNPNVYLSLMGVSDRCELFTGFTNNHEEVGLAMDKLIGGETGFGNNDQPFDFALQIFNRQREADNKYMLVMADGVWAHQGHAIDQSKFCNQADIETIGLGFGDADEQFMKAVSSKESVMVNNSSDLGEGFSQVLRIIG